MIRSAKVALALLLAAPAGVAHSAEAARAATTQQKQDGRFVVVFSPLARADTFLVDTQTGRTWSMVRFTDLEGDPRGWQPIPQINTPADAQAVYRDNVPKKTGGSQPQQ
jgi:hypothetical protein